jgi:xylulose-5-phosphate/fructose-6-phosphate phosphoketolase
MWRTRSVETPIVLAFPAKRGLRPIRQQRDLDVPFVCGPGHGGPALAQTWLEGSYTETYPHVSRDGAGMQRLFRRFSFPGASPPTPPRRPRVHQRGGELGYSLLHAYGAAFHHPDLIMCCVIGHGEAETGALATSWHANKFLNPARDGAVLPVLHLNGYKIANPTVLARIPEEELAELLGGYGHDPVFVEGDEPEAVHQTI